MKKVFDLFMFLFSIIRLILRVVPLALPILARMWKDFIFLLAILRTEIDGEKWKEDVNGKALFQAGKAKRDHAREWLKGFSFFNKIDNNILDVGLQQAYNLFKKKTGGDEVIGSILLAVAKIAVPVLIEKIFAAEEDHPAPYSGNAKRDAVHKATKTTIEENKLFFDDDNVLAALIDAQVKVLKKDNAGSALILGPDIVNTTVKCIVDQEERDPDAPDKLASVIAAVRKELGTSPGVSTGAVESLIKKQVELFDAFGIFTKTEPHH